MSSSSDQHSVKLCEQRKTNGDPCESSALHGKNFCHYHEFSGAPPIDINNSSTIPSTHIYLPHLGDAASIQSAISEVCEMMLHRRIEPKEASALFYAMQVASSNLDHLPANKNRKPISGTIQACEQPKRRNRRLRA